MTEHAHHNIASAASPDDAAREAAPPDELRSSSTGQPSAPEARAKASRAQRFAATLDQLHHLRLGQPQPMLRRRLVADGQILPRSGPLQLRRYRQIETHAHHLAQGYTANPAHMHDSTFRPFCGIIFPDESGELMNPPLF